MCPTVGMATCKWNKPFLYIAVERNQTEQGREQRQSGGWCWGWEGSSNKITKLDVPLQKQKSYTVEPRYNNPRYSMYNDIPGITINMLCPVKSYSEIICMGQNPDITIFNITIFPI